MSKKFQKKPLALSIGAAVATTLAAVPIVNAETNPFGMNELSSGYMQVAQEQSGKKEMQCGAGKCGGKMKGDKNAQGNCAGKKTEQSCGAGKCGAGKCGASKDKAAGKTDGSCGAGKCGASKNKAAGKTDGSCGAGKCGAKKMDKTSTGGN